MDVAPYMPIIAEATKFVFDEIGKWIDDVRQHSKKPVTMPSEDIVDTTVPKLTQEEFVVLEANPPQLAAAINVHTAKSDAYEIQGLVNQIQIHRRNLVDFETVETEYGFLTPPHIKRGIEREADAIIEKSIRLTRLLEQVYERRIENA